jgi:hypothetical protein
VGTRAPKSIQIYIYIPQYITNVSYIVERQWGGPVVAYCILLLTAGEDAQPPGNQPCTRKLKSDVLMCLDPNKEVQSMMMSLKTSKSAFGRFLAISNGAVVFIQTQLKWHKY